MKKLLIIATIAILIYGCNYKKEESLATFKTTEKLNFIFEKVVVVNLGETCITYLKIKISNKSDKTIVIQDNSLVEYYSKKTKPEKKGFYLKRVSKDSIIPLGIDNYYFMEITPKSNNYYFIGAKDLDHSFELKDSLLLKEVLSNYIIEYNGLTLDLNTIEKSKYIGKNDFEKFTKERSNYIPFKDSISIKFPSDIKINYLDKQPVRKEDWDKL